MIQFLLILPFMLDLGFYLNGVIYPPNATLDLIDIGVDGSSLRYLTPLMPCCRGTDNPNGGALGDWTGSFLMDQLFAVEVKMIVYQELEELVQFFFIVLTI